MYAHPDRIPVLEPLEPRLLLVGYYGLEMPDGWNPQQPDPGDLVDAVFVPEYDWIRDNADYDWWYGSGPTVGAMLTAWHERTLQVTNQDYSLSLFPGDSTNWQYGQIGPGASVDRETSINSALFKVPDFANGAAAGWAYASEAFWSAFEVGGSYNEMWSGEGWVSKLDGSQHPPDCLADFLETQMLGAMSEETLVWTQDRGQTPAAATPWGLQNYFAWDDPRTVENESWAASATYFPREVIDAEGEEHDVDTLNILAGIYKVEISVGRPAILLIQRYERVTVMGIEVDEPRGALAVLGVGDNGLEISGTGVVSGNYDLFTGWNTGLEEWSFADWQGDNLTWKIEGLVLLELDGREMDTPTAYLAIQTQDASQLAVQIGMTGSDVTLDVEIPEEAEGRANFVLTDIHLTDFLPDMQDDSQQFFLDVSSADGSSGAILDFQVRYNDLRWMTADTHTPFTDTAGRAYVTSELLGEVAGTLWNDLDDDGVRDEGEPGLAGRHVSLWNTRTFQAWGADTAEDGSYSFSGLLPDIYRVRQTSIPDGWSATTDQEQRVRPGQTANLGSHQIANLTGGGAAHSSFTPQTLSAGVPLQVTWRVTNDSAALSNAFAISFYASVDDDLSTTADNYLLGTADVSSLSAGSSVDVQIAQDSLGHLLVGTYYVGAVIDPDGAVRESNEADNQAIDDAYPLTVPGLTGQVWHDLNADGTRQAGEAGMAGRTVYLDANNNGQLNAGETSTTTDDDGSYSFRFLGTGSYRVRQVLPAGWTATATVANPVAYTAGAVRGGLDFGNAGTGLADLCDDGERYSQIQPGTVTALLERCDIWWDILNSGAGAAGSFRVDFYATADDSLSTTADNYFLGQVEIAGLAAGGAISVQLPVLRFPNLPAGVYYVGIVIDPLNQVPEADESNNTALDLALAATLEVEHAVDLQAVEDGDRGFGPALAKPDQAWSATLDIFNAGGQSGIGFYVSFYASNGAEGNEYPLGAVYVGSLGSEETRRIELDLAQFPSLPVGSYYVNARIDDLDDQDEFDETNNAVNISGTLTVPGLTGPVTHDMDGDGRADQGEPAINGWTVYIDANSNGQYDLGEQYTRTGPDGRYNFPGLAAGTYTLGLRDQPGWSRTGYLGKSYGVTVVADQIVTGMADLTASLLSKVVAESLHDENGDGSGEGYFVAEPELEYKERNRVITLFRDVNGNHRVDVGELSYSEITYANPNTWGTAMLCNVLAGEYYLIEAGVFNVEEGILEDGLPDGWVRTYPEEGYDIRISGAQLVGRARDHRFASAHGVGIEGVVYNDLNANGIRNVGEPGLSGWTVTLDTGDTAITDGSGAYRFAGLKPRDDYTITEVLKPGWTRTAPGEGGYARTIHDHTGFGNIVTNLNFGNYQDGRITGTVWHDLDADGVFKESSEPGLGNWTVFIDADGDGIRDGGERYTTSGDDGAFTLSGLAVGTYQVRAVLQSGWAQSAPATGVVTAVIASGQEVEAQFGVYLPAGLGGRVWADQNANGGMDADEQGLEGWRVYLDQNRNGVWDAGERSVLSDDADGYFFSGLKPGDYVVRQVAPSGWVLESPASGAWELTLSSSSTSRNINFLNYQPVGLEGKVWNDVNGDGQDAGEDGMAGWTVYVDLDGNGHRNWTDANGNGVFDAGIDSGDPWVLTAADGTYAFAGLPPAELTLTTETLATWRMTQPSAGGYTIQPIAGGTTADLDFGFSRTGYLGGVVWHDVDPDQPHDGQETPLEGWTVAAVRDDNANGQADPNETTRLLASTDADGAYLFSDVLPGPYVVILTPAATYLAVDAEQLATVQGAQTSTVDFAAHRQPQAQDLAFETDEDAPLEGAVAGSDFEQQPLTFSVANQPDHGVVALAADGTFTYTPDEDYNGEDSFTYLANDGLGDSQPATVTVTVGAVNDGPIAVEPDDPYELDEDEQLTLQLGGYDEETPEGLLTFAIVSQPSHGSLTVDGATVIYTPLPDYYGADSFHFTVTDTAAGGGQPATSGPATVELQVLPINDAPVAIPGSGEVLDEDQATIELAASDVETAAADLVYEIVTQPAHGTVDLQGSVAAYTPNLGWGGSDTFSFRVRDRGPTDSGDDPLESAPAVVSVFTVPSQPFGEGNAGIIEMAPGSEARLIVSGGPGEGTLYWSQPGQISLIVLTGTTSRTKVTILCSEPLTVGDIRVEGPLAALTGKTTQLTGELNVHGGLGKLRLDSLQGGSILVNTDEAVTEGSLTIQLNQVLDGSIDTHGLGIKTLRAMRWANTPSSPVETIRAAWIGSLKITGWSRWDVAGDMTANLVLTGENSPAWTFKSASIKGSLTDSQWQIAGSLRGLGVGREVRDTQVRATGSLSSLKLGASRGSDFLAGVDSGAGRWAADEQDFVDTLAAIGSIKIAGWRVPRGSPIPRFLEDTNFSAARIGKVKLLNGDFVAGQSGIYVLADALGGPLRWVRHVDSADRANNWYWRPGIGSDYQGPADYIHLL